MNRRFKLGFVALAAALLLGACASLPPGVQSAIGRAAGSLTVLTPHERVVAAADMLERGDEASAKNQLDIALRQEPTNAEARRLLASIDSDPHAQFGNRNHAYVVHEGDTMPALAERNLGDRLMSYALARYNNMKPNELHVGQTILIPDRAHTMTASTSRPPPSSPTPVTPAPTPVAVSAEAAARANRLRLQALEHLNAGDADGAVTLLRQAQTADATNPAIQRDLSRAQRIQASLSANH